MNPQLIFAMFLATLFALRAVVTISLIGEERERVTHSQAVITTVLTGIIIFGILYFFV